MKNRWEEELNQKICAIDIDGVLNYYPDTWVDYINSSLNTSFKTLNEAKEGIPYKQYKDLKWQYRECGIKAQLKVREGAKELLDELKRRGYQILIITSRPFDSHKSLFKQTVDWLQNGELQYDGIIFGKEKYVEVLTKVPNIRFLIDDHLYYCNSVSKWGYDTFLVNTIYNLGKTLDKVHRINSLLEVLNYDFI